METVGSSINVQARITEADIGRVDKFLQEHEEELRALLVQCATRRPREEGIPAILIVDDLTSQTKSTLTLTPTDQERGPFFADMALAIALLVEEAGGDPLYPSICPAMSAICEWRFGDEPFGAWNREQA